MVLTQQSAPSGRADACTVRQLCLANLPAAEAETIRLMFQIMGWAVIGNDPHGSRLAMRAQGNIIEVACDDRRLAATLATAGLDRLVMPVSLLALEQLMVFAG